MSPSLQADAVGVPGIRAAVSDARSDSTSPTASADAVLLLGPLYHLGKQSRPDRPRSVRPRACCDPAAFCAAAISPGATRIDGMIGNRIYRKYPARART